MRIESAASVDDLDPVLGSIVPLVRLVENALG